MALPRSSDEPGNRITYTQAVEPLPLPMPGEESVNPCDRTKRQFDVETLPSILWVDRQHLPPCPAVYLLLTVCPQCQAPHQVLYIGRTSCLHQRAHTHTRTRQFAAASGLRITWWAIHDASERRNFEVRMIEQFPTALNDTRGPADIEGSVMLHLRLPADLAGAFEAWTTGAGTSVTAQLVALMTGWLQTHAAEQTQAV